MLKRNQELLKNAETVMKKEVRRFYVA